ncbi:hypothetical protein BDK51DRAFT_30967 [Blyttiomyces helicus]|uniref:Uncharacterized protein n=1 Tax=Blyttiomyces helicus TaxID=388810 RepID=A0A4P9WNU1_9FUNG|nr:hypothetical protein BDK51DRAFT_30967 [Blyttiomyces helicus]|eukprot:RKO94811.1 hypothetical protein BDK51DRAFT_30967 [Blyttiomyces helicus]
MAGGKLSIVARTGSPGSRASLFRAAPGQQSVAPAPNRRGKKGPAEDTEAEEASKASASTGFSVFTALLPIWPFGVDFHVVAIGADTISIDHRVNATGGRDTSGEHSPKDDLAVHLEDLEPVKDPASDPSFKVMMRTTPTVTDAISALVLCQPRYTRYFFEEVEGHK